MTRSWRAGLILASIFVLICTATQPRGAEPSAKKMVLVELFTSQG